MNELLIGLIVILFFFELMLISSKNPIYYRSGIPIFKKHIQCTYEPKFNEYFINEISNEKISIFISLIDFIKISDIEIAFCEEKRGHFIYYPPVMHGIIRLDNINNRIYLTGYLNWYILSTIVFFIILIVFDISFFFKGAISSLNLLIIYIIICYLILKLQYSIYNKIIDSIESIIN